jgi:hypothetical protein
MIPSQSLPKAEDAEKALIPALLTPKQISDHRRSVPQHSRGSSSLGTPPRFKEPDIIGNQPKAAEMTESPLKQGTIGRNPFARFYGDSNSKPIFEEESRKKKPPHNIKACLPKEESDSFINSDENEEERMILTEINPASITFFNDGSREHVFTKLLWFTPNKKNGRHLVYNSEKLNCTPVFKCEGCEKEFEVASALGGHLSRCDFKEDHCDRLAGPESLPKKEI